MTAHSPNDPPRPGLLTREDVKAMTADQLATAKAQGLIYDAAEEAPLTRDELKSMTPEEIMKARTLGRLDGLLGKGPNR